MLEEASFRAAANEPTERQVFEHTIAIVLAPLHGVQWDDVGAWNAGYQISDRDGDGNVLHGDVIAMNTKNSLIQSQGRLVAVIGMQDTIVIDTPDAVLVAHRSHAQSVKQLVERLKAAKRSEVASQTAHDTPWGRIETIASDAAQDMRIMTVHPGASLSVNGTGVGPSLLTVISGEGHYTIGGKVVTARRGQSVALDAGHALPLSNRTPRDLTLIHLVFRSGSDASEPLHDAFPGAATIDAPLFPQEVL